MPKFTIESAALILKSKSKSKLSESGVIFVEGGSLQGKTACAAYHYLRYKAPNCPRALIVSSL